MGMKGALACSCAVAGISYTIFRYRRCFFFFFLVLTVNVSISKCIPHILFTLAVAFPLPCATATALRIGL